MKRPIAVFLASGLFLLGACGDDDDGAASSGSPSAPAAGETDEPTGSDDGEQAAGNGEFCSGYTELLSGDPAPDEIRALIDIAPEDAKEPLETIATGFEEDGEGFFESEAFGESFGALGAAANEECADEVIEVTAIDYGFEGIPDEVSAGTLGVTFSNEGDELHEMVVFRKNDDTTESFDDIFANEDQAAAEALVTEAGATFAVPGQTASGLFTLEEPGEYVAVCFIPVGTTPESDEASGPPHFSQGMKAEFSVG